MVFDAFYHCHTQLCPSRFRGIKLKDNPMAGVRSEGTSVVIGDDGRLQIHAPDRKFNF